MANLLCDLEIDAACWEFLAHRIVARTRPPQPIVEVLDSAPPEDDPDWDELTARAARLCSAPGQETTVQLTERVLAQVEE